MKEYHVAVVGAGSTVGNETIDLLAQRDFPIQNLRLLASERSAGTRVRYKEERIAVDILDEHSFDGIDIVFFSSEPSVSAEFAPRAVRSGAVVIDNTSVFCLKPEVPLVVPEVNPEALRGSQGIIAAPDSLTTQLLVALKPIHDAAIIDRLVISTYQAVSGTGDEAIQELHEQTRHIFLQRDIVCQVYPHQIAFNCLPHIDVFLENGCSRQEMRVVHETRKILEDDGIRITATAVQVPVFYGHSASVNIETDRKITADDVRELLSNAPGVTVIDDPCHHLYPLATDAAGEDAVFVGRIREDDSIETGINLWIVSDNVRKGAALNAVQIAEKMIDMELM
ncbi:aspartate-semialdehyde dehydrogenase [candidate division KSB3 bacterium]|uniref:Aspartate-semialdehyde dehydrogenase n=1 Tax=candidate division KSB3 bacterium TaxID=2044937 RepID=A0A2G6E232_9BACT|nr:MAG: aspartate-semialdehyde dehydrogenase [candidate division KSB3 bacterium]PIE30333.1 MAG: aspartate-semialdehyde dehydrogenase [candidate division KSB3 bacterium]